MSRYRKSWSQAMQEVQESAALQLKMAFDDAKIKIKGTKGGKLVVAKKDKKKVEQVIAKQMKKPADAKRVLGSQIVFEEVELDEADYKYDGKVVKISKKNFSKVHKDFKNSTKGKERMLINDPKTGGSISVPVQFEEVELDEADAAYPPTIKNLKMIVKDKQNQVFMFPSGKARVDLFTASAMVQVYDALKPALKKTFEKMIADKGGFMKTQAFAMKMMK